jgi:DNA-binding transcriptional LysR family regulator
LFVTQPTISKQIKLLEKSLGVPLFYRKSGRVLLTPSGELLYEKFSKIYCLIEDSISEALQKSTVGEFLVIGFPTTLDMENILIKLFSSFSTKYPSINLELYTSDFDDIYMKLNNEKLDIIFSYSLETKTDKLSDIYRLPISRTRPYLYYHHSLITSNELPPLEYLKKYPVVFLEQSSVTNNENFILKTATSLGFNINHAIKTTSMETLCFYVESAKAITILGKSYQISKNNEIKFIELTNNSTVVGTDMFWKKNPYNPIVQIFVNHVQNYMTINNNIKAIDNK